MKFSQTEIGRSFLRTSVPLCLGMLCATAAYGEGPAGARANAEAGRTPLRTEIVNHASWIVACDYYKPPRSRKCSARTQVVPRGSNRPVLILTVYLDETARHPRLLIESPTNVQIGPGVQVTLADGVSQRAAFQTCAQNGCSALVPDDPKFLTAMQNSKDVNVTITGLDGNAIKFDFPLNGANPAITAVMSK